MSFGDTDIRWTDKTWNPVHGCSRSGSPGCANCYAETVSRRFEHTEHPWVDEYAEENVQLKPEYLDDRVEDCWVFLNSMSDLYHEQVPDEFIGQVYEACADMDDVAFQVLSKHGPDNERDAMHPPDNVMLGVSVGHPDWEYRIDWLRDQPAATKFVSFEPLVAPIKDVDLFGIDWAIIGGESGADSRRRGMDPDWARQLIYQCRTNDVDVFFKQHSGRYPEDDISIELAGQQQRIEQFPDLPDGVAPAPQEFRDRDAEVIIG